MTQYFRFVPLAVTSALLASAGVGCLGHSQEIEDATKNPGSSSGASTSTGATGGTGTGGTGTGGTGTGGTGTGGTDAGTGGSGAVGGTGTSACDMVTTQRWDMKTMPGYTQPRDPKVDQLVGRMTNTQKFYQMMGSNDGHDMNYNDIERSTDVMLDDGTLIRGYQYRDAGRGNNLAAPQVPPRAADDGNNFSTVFPVESARAASWDTELEYDVGEAMGDEVMASKNMMLLAPCMNTIRHPYWGRTQETYGEDSYHIGRMASAMTAGIQQHVAACAKHYAANNVENGRQNQDAVMDEQTLREIYAKHFDMVVEDAGVACVMAAYNKINGIKSTVNTHLLRDILKAPVAQGGMGFRGLVISDWWAMPGGQVGSLDATTAQKNSKDAVNAGLDVEVPWWLNFGRLGDVVGNGVDISLINDAVGRILEQKFRFKQAIAGTDGFGLGTAKSALGVGTTSASIYYADHVQLAEDAEVKSAVLLQNGLAGAPAVLPFKNYANIAVIGADEDFTLQSTTNPKSCGATTKGTCTFHHATDVNLGDRGSSRVNADPAQSIGPFDGITAVGMNGHGVTNVTKGTTAADVGNADAVVVVVGLTPGDEGEEYALKTGGDRKSLDLPAGQADLVASVLALGKPTVIIVQSGSIVNLPWLQNTASPNQATIWAGYSGMHGGKALARLIFADQGANFSGKMPMAWPTKDQLALLPFTESAQSTTMGYFFGYRFYDFKNMSDGLVYPFGHGLSYTTFTYDTLQVPCQQVGQNAIINVTVNVKNTGPVAGDEVALLFVKGPKPASDTSGAARPVKQLASFAKVHLEAGASAPVTLPVRIQDLKHWQGDEKTGKWVIDPGAYTVLVGPSGADKDLTLMDTFTVQG
jgi:beta-glucosidase